MMVIPFNNDPEIRSRNLEYSHLLANNDEILFRDLISENETEIKTYMSWENYDLNNTIIPVTEKIKDHALKVLSQSYGKFHVEQSILDELCADVFIYFPILLQQLGISRLMDAYGVVADDINTETFTRTELLESENEQNNELTVGTTNTDTTLLDTQQKTTGTVNVGNDMTSTQNSSTSIENSSGVEMTGNRNVNLNHNMPEQALTETGNFPVDLEGTPILKAAFVQAATESFNSSNPINSTETSEQTIANRTNGTNDSLTTNDITVADSGTNTKTSVNSGKDNSVSNSLTTAKNTITENRETNETNKQYAYEIKAFLESTDTLVAFGTWENRFSWVVGIV